MKAASTWQQQHPLQQRCRPTVRTAGRGGWALLLLLILFGAPLSAHAVSPKWTFLVYMLADNDLECFAIDDMEELMLGMAVEPPSGCSTAACGAACPSGTAAVSQSACSDGSASLRCCPTDSYPDVFVWVDRGASSCFVNQGAMVGMDTTLLSSSWSNVREFQLLPGGKWQQRTSYPEMDLSDPDVFAQFLASGLQAFPPDPNRRHALVLWNHGAGWAGYGIDHTCSPVATYSDRGCDMLTMETLARGLDKGLTWPAGSSTKYTLDIIGFDACLMSMVEVAAAVSPYAKYLLSSEILEPGQGWDYTTLGNVTRAAATTSLSATDVGSMFIQGYLSAGYANGCVGLTLALVDLTVEGRFRSDLMAVARALTVQIQGANGNATGLALLQQRTRLGTIAGAEENVDVGSMLGRFSSSLSRSKATGAVSLITAAQASYAACVASFMRDNDLPDGTGMAIYFPVTRSKYDPWYQNLVTTYSSSLGDWQTFLNAIYSLGEAIAGSVSAGTEFRFVEPYGVTYWATSARAWITHGSLTAPLGLTATLMYGFSSPDGNAWIMAGSVEGAVTDVAASGAWTGYLFGLVQDLDKSDSDIDSLSLAYADEDRQYRPDGTVGIMNLQVKVYYAASCQAAVADLKTGMIKYTLNMTSGKSTMRLFVSSTEDVTGTWGEISTQQGGVIIPYLGKVWIDSSGSAISGSSFGYSSCLKWGYAGSIDVAAFNVQQAADVLGLDLTKDLMTRLVVDALDGSSASMAGLFQPAQRTKAGCQCSQLWPYTWANGTTTLIPGTCINPTDAAGGAWCVIEPDSCPIGATPAATGWDYCPQATTLAGCRCARTYQYEGTTFYGTCNNIDQDPAGSWCVVDAALCPSAARAHGGGAALDYDYCQARTQSGCFCSNSWTFSGVTYHGTCRTGLPSGRSSPHITPNTSWCYVDPATCPFAKHLDGYAFDICSPAAGRITTSGDACILPASYNGVPVYDCVAYNQSTTATSVTPWCFTAAGVQATCKPLTCTQGVMRACPTASPPQADSATADNMAPWAAAPCVQALCSVRAALANMSACVDDSAADRSWLEGLFSYLDSSAPYAAALAAAGAATPSAAATSSSTTTAGGSVTGSTNATSGATSQQQPPGLSEVCNIDYGQLCVDAVIDPACPAVFRDNNYWLIRTAPEPLCNLPCLQALCTLQRRRRHFNSSTGDACADADLEMLIRWDLMDLMDSTCGWGTPAPLKCLEVLSPPPACPPSTMVSNATTGTLSDGSLIGSNYSANTECQWTLEAPETPYIDLSFSRFDTEPQYDTVVVEDMDGVIGIFSGTSSPGNLSTDNGLLRLTFTSDGTIQRSGWAANYTASHTVSAQLPDCGPNGRVVQAHLRTRQSASEISWTVVRSAPIQGAGMLSGLMQQATIVMAGGLLPAAVAVSVPPSVSATAAGEYKDLRSYTSYACLPIGSYTVNMYDSYGDGWGGGRLSLAALVSSTGPGGQLDKECALVSDTVLQSTNSIPFTVKAAGSANETCAAMGFAGHTHFIQADLVLKGESATTFTLTKQKRLRDALAALMEVDTDQVAILSWAAAPAAARRRRLRELHLLSEPAQPASLDDGHGFDGSSDGSSPRSIRDLIADERATAFGTAQRSKNAGNGPAVGPAPNIDLRALLPVMRPLSQLAEEGVFSNSEDLLYAMQTSVAGSPPAGESPWSAKGATAGSLSSVSMQQQQKDQGPQASQADTAQRRLHMLVVGEGGSLEPIVNATAGDPAAIAALKSLNIPSLQGPEGSGEPGAAGSTEQATFGVASGGEASGAAAGPPIPPPPRAGGHTVAAAALMPTPPLIARTGFKRRSAGAGARPRPGTPAWRAGGYGSDVSTRGFNAQQAAELVRQRVSRAKILFVDEAGRVVHSPPPAPAGTTTSAAAANGEAVHAYAIGPHRRLLDNNTGVFGPEEAMATAAAQHGTAAAHSAGGVFGGDGRTDALTAAFKSLLGPRAIITGPHRDEPAYALGGVPASGPAAGSGGGSTNGSDLVGPRRLARMELRRRRQLRMMVVDDDGSLHPLDATPSLAPVATVAATQRLSPRAAAELAALGGGVLRPPEQLGRPDEGDSGQLGAAGGRSAAWNGNAGGVPGAAPWPGGYGGPGATPNLGPPAETDTRSVESPRGRMLQQQAASSSSRVLATIKVSGFASATDASAAASALSAATTNGSLAATLARQGWTDASISVTSITTGNTAPADTSIAGRLRSLSAAQRRIVIIAVAAAVALLIAGALIGLFIFRMRRSASAQMANSRAAAAAAAAAAAQDSHAAGGDAFAQLSISGSGSAYQQPRSKSAYSPGDPPAIAQEHPSYAGGFATPGVGGYGAAAAGYGGAAYPPTAGGVFMPPVGPYPPVALLPSGSGPAPGVLPGATPRTHSPGGSDSPYQHGPRASAPPTAFYPPAAAATQQMQQQRQGSPAGWMAVPPSPHPSTPPAGGFVDHAGWGELAGADAADPLLGRRQ